MTAFFYKNALNIVILSPFGAKVLHFTLLPRLFSFTFANCPIRNIGTHLCS